MEKNTKNLTVLANRFIVEELKQRIEFDITMEDIGQAAAESKSGWKERKYSMEVKVGTDGKPSLIGKVSW